MARWSIVITVYQKYELVRQLVESIWNFIDPDNYEKIIIVDDYSDPNGKLRQYLDWLKEKEKFHIVMEDDFRYLHFYQYNWIKDKRKDEFFDYEKFDLERPTRGHLPSVLEGCKYVDTEFVFVMDMDTFFLKGSESLFKRLEKEFDNREKVLIVGDSHYSKNYDPVEYDRLNLGVYYNEDLVRGHGFVNTPACAIRTDSWKRYNIDMIRPDWEKIRAATNRKLTGILWGQFVPKLFEAGFHSLHYPIFGKRNVLHLGRSVIKRNTVDKAPIMYSTYGFCRDWFGPYGARKGPWELEDWRAGRCYVDMESEEYDKFLEQKYDKPFEAVQMPLSDELIKAVDEDFDG